MKRRKKLWIACAALAVVVALCAFALSYQPVPYQFLKGATLDRNESSLMHFTPAGAPTVRVRAYSVSRTVEAVILEARKELTPRKGWIEPQNGDDPTFLLDSEETWVFIYSSEHIPDVRPPHTVVVVVRPANLFDRFLTWLSAL